MLDQFAVGCFFGLLSGWLWLPFGGITRPPRRWLAVFLLTTSTTAALANPT